MANIAFLGTGLLGGAFAEAAAQARRHRHCMESFAGQRPRPSLRSASRPPRRRPRRCGARRACIWCSRTTRWSTKSLPPHAPGFRPEAVLIDHTTTLPALTAARAKRLAAEGVKYLHCPVFMGPPAARKAQGSMMVAGPQALFESVKAELARMTGRLEYMGERADLAAVNKLFGNAMIICVSAAMADILTIAQASGVPRRGRHQAAGLARPERDGGRARRQHGQGQLHRQLRAGHGAQGCAADAGSRRQPAAWPRCPRSRPGWISSSRRVTAQGRQRAGHRRGARP